MVKIASMKNYTHARSIILKTLKNYNTSPPAPMYLIKHTHCDPSQFSLKIIAKTRISVSQQNVLQPNTQPPNPVLKLEHQHQLMTNNHNMNKKGEPLEKGVPTEDSNERTAPVVMWVSMEETVSANLCLGHERSQEG